MGWGGLSLSYVWKCQVVKKMLHMCPIAHVLYHPCLPSRSMHYYAQFQEDPCSVSKDLCRTKMHPYTHLDLPGINQNLFATARFMVSSNVMKKNSDHLTLGAANQKSHKHVSHFCPSKDFLIWTLHTLRASLDWPLTSFWTSQPKYKTCSGPSKKFTMSQSQTVNHKNSQKVPFGS